MAHYRGQLPVLVAIDCIIFGFDGQRLQLLLIQRDFEPEKNKLSLMGGFLQSNETTDEAANRILRQLTGLEGVYMEQLHTFSAVDRDPLERTVSIAYFALIDIHRYERQINNLYQAKWFPLQKRPALIFDHNEMVDLAIRHLRYKAATHPLLFELLPEKFTIPQLQSLYEGVYGTLFDPRNFNRKIMATGLLIKQAIKDKSSSKKGAYYYKLDRRKYRLRQRPVLPERFI